MPYFILGNANLVTVAEGILHHGNRSRSSIRSASINGWVGVDIDKIETCVEVNAVTLLACPNGITGLHGEALSAALAIEVTEDLHRRLACTEPPLACLGIDDEERNRRRHAECVAPVRSSGSDGERIAKLLLRVHQKRAVRKERVVELRDCAIAVLLSRFHIDVMGPDDDGVYGRKVV